MAKTQELDAILVSGACEHNLKNVDVEIPKKKLVIFTGVSGSGKSSLAFDTIFAEGQRRYVESLSAYARQFLGQLEKPKFETIRGLSPTIAIEQKAASKNPRSTVGTITEVYDYLRVLYARIGEQFCHICGKRVGRGDAASMVEQIMELPEGTRILLLAPIIENRKGEHRELFGELAQSGFSRVRIDGVVRELSDVQALAKHKKHTIEVVIDRLVIKRSGEFKQRLTDSVETALKRGQSAIIVHVQDREDIRMSEARSCCGFAFPELAPPLFSFNAPLGMCPTCSGLGSLLIMDEQKIIPDPSLSIKDGAIIPWRGYFKDGETGDGWGAEKLKAISKQFGIDLNTPWKKLSKKHRDILLRGSGEERVTVKWRGERSQGSFSTTFEGLLPRLMRRFEETQSDEMKQWYGKFMSTRRCETCDGARLKPEVLAVRISGKSIMDVCSMTTADAAAFFAKLELKGNQLLIAKELLKEVRSRLGFLVNVGLDYLTLDRKGPTLSGGEAQRIRLASQIGSELTGVLYILDEPSIGLHQRDNQKLLATLCHLRDIGNTLIVVEHDQETIEAADWVLDIGPGAGHLGGRIVAQGTPAEIRRNPHSLTGRYLSGKETIAVPTKRRVPPSGRKDEGWVTVVGATENNLRDVTARFPLGLMTCVTGVSGAGKSSLINQILYPALSRQLHDADIEVGAHKSITGLDQLDKVINIDQRPIGRTPRSNPATYTKLFDLVRDFYALLPEARARGYQKGRFSFNVKGGRCEACQGDGYLTVEMHFLADILVPCETCKGRRFNESTLQIKYKDYSIADVLDMSVAEAERLFEHHPKIAKVLKTLIDVGLSYIKLGQPATTLSGGEAQRIKLAKELARADTGHTLYILDEPTTGLHFDDIRKLLVVLERLVAAGNTVVVIEHNLDVIKTADWIIDMGPEGGFRGGQIIAQGTPEDVAKVKKSYTGNFLARMVAKR
ncbi:MAG: excinuclease ABC subunit UvrA [Deltaproteobacteria bacterium]|nr:excinuclease ABC subunit UvrA [Deltaproteobacteria bacterium]